MYFIPLYFISLYFISLYISHFTYLTVHTHYTYLTLSIASCDNTAFQEWSMQLLVWAKSVACPCAYLACMSSFWAMCMCVAPAVQQLPHYMHTPAGKQLHDFVCMYSSCPTASQYLYIHVHLSCPTAFILHVHPSWQPAMCVCMLKMHVCESLCVCVCLCMLDHAKHTCTKA